MTPLQAVLRYRDLVRVEDLFRRAKAILRHPAPGKVNIRQRVHSPGPVLPRNGRRGMSPHPPASPLNGTPKPAGADVTASE